MSAAIDIKRGDVARAASFVEYTKVLPFRLPPLHESDLRIVFTELETDAGMRTRYWMDFERMMGVVADTSGSALGSRDSDEEDVHLYDLERYCDRVHVWSKVGRSARVSKCRAALAALGETSEGRVQVILLHLAYGLPDPNAPYQHWSGELAAIARHTPAVEERRREMVAAFAAKVSGRTLSASDERESARQQSIANNEAARAKVAERIEALQAKVTRIVFEITKLRARFDAAPREMSKRRPIAKRIRRLRKSQQRAIDAIPRARAALPALAADWANLARQRPSRAAAAQTATEIANGADNAVTASDALQAALDVSIVKRDKETREMRRARRKAVEAVRAVFVSRVAKEAAEMLAAASLAYLTARSVLK